MQSVARNAACADVCVTINIMSAISHHVPRSISLKRPGPDGGGSYGFRIVGDGPVFVQWIGQNSTAEIAGLAIGDRIVGIDGNRVHGMHHDDIVALMQKPGRGSRLRLVVVNDGIDAIPTKENPSPQKERSDTPLNGNNVEDLRIHVQTFVICCL